MKNFFLLLNLILFCSCFAQEKKSIRELNDYLLNNNYVPFGDVDSTELKGIKSAISKYRLLGTKSCNINPDKKYSHIYIEDGFNDEEGFYNGIFIIDNKNIFEVTNSPYKLRQDSLSYTKVKEKNKFVFFTKKLSIDDFRNNYVDEYFRYELVIQDKVDSFKRCLAIDQYTPKSIIYARSYYFGGEGVRVYNLPVKYSNIKNGIEGLPYFKEDKKKEFIKCINQLNILKIHNSSNVKAFNIPDL
ncbi:hypothetical protein [uncultured Chryseobacterium sp.]|uniref:hypothetical protein n=1 Tax=uncultured Chryseobacterium sp. TaxID=259322 RepID=UPI00258F29A5|nr:hypothetical protein [uncultured Chryseobacterium sp.]